MDRQIPPHEPKIVLAVAAHPDDLEFGASGSVAAWVNAGAEVHYLICTDASKGTDDMSISSVDLIKIRRAEQQAAADILGVTSVTFLNYEDGLTDVTHELKRDIAKRIREVKPDTVVAQDPEVLYNADFGMINHSDHRNVGLAAMDAVYPLARDHLSFPELAAAGLAPHKVKDLLFMDMGSNKANHFVDISTTFETKMQALAAHESQVDMDEVHGWLDGMTKELGKRGGVERAEAFIRLNLFI